jgi:DNA-binding GntR family transcriptional regulator
MPMTGEEEEAELGSTVLLHAEVYRTLRWRLATGKLLPGIGLSTRGIAEELGVSQMPVREALGRLSAEGAIEIRSRRKIMITPMTTQRLADLVRCRLLLEPESARCALPHLDEARRRVLHEADSRIRAACVQGDIDGVMEANFDFHFALYRAHREITLNRLIESLWLQFGPYVRLVCESCGTGNIALQHKRAIDAIERSHAADLGRAIYDEVETCMGLVARYLDEAPQS